MNHQEIKDKLNDFIDGQVSDSERISTEIHLRHCKECSDIVNDWKSISPAFFRPAPLPPTDFFVTKVMAHLEDGPYPGAVWGGYWKVPAFALALVALFLIFSPPPDETPPSLRNMLLTNGDSMVQTSISADELELDSLLEISGETI